MDAMRLLSQLLAGPGKEKIASSPFAPGGEEEENAFGLELAQAFAVGVAAPGRPLDTAAARLAEGAMGAPFANGRSMGRGLPYQGPALAGGQSAAGIASPGTKEGIAGVGLAAPRAGAASLQPKAAPGGLAAVRDAAALQLQASRSASGAIPAATLQQAFSAVSPSSQNLPTGLASLAARGLATAAGDRGFGSPPGNKHGLDLIAGRGSSAVAPNALVAPSDLSRALVDAIRQAGAGVGGGSDVAPAPTAAAGQQTQLPAQAQAQAQGAPFARLLANEHNRAHASGRLGTASAPQPRAPAARLDRTTGTVQLQLGTEAAAVHLAAPLSLSGDAPHGAAPGHAATSSPQQQEKSETGTSESPALEREPSGLANGQQPSHTKQAPVAEAPIARATQPRPMLDETLDPTLQLRFVPGGARIAMQAPGTGELTVQLDIREGVADLRVGGAAAWLVGANVEELRVALAQEGLTLGKLDQGEGSLEANSGDRHAQGGADEGRDDPGGQPGAGNRGATPGASSPTTPTAVLRPGAGRHHVEA